MLLQLLQLQKPNDCTHNSCFFYKLKGLILNLNETQLELKKLLQQNSFLIPPILYFFNFFGIEQRRDEEKRQAILKMLTHTDVGTTTTCI